MMTMILYKYSKFPAVKPQINSILKNFKAFKTRNPEDLLEKLRINMNPNKFGR